MITATVGMLGIALLCAIAAYKQSMECDAYCRRSRKLSNMAQTRRYVAQLHTQGTHDDRK